MQLSRVQAAPAPHCPAVEVLNCGWSRTECLAAGRASVVNDEITRRGSVSMFPMTVGLMPLLIKKDPSGLCRALLADDSARAQAGNRLLIGAVNHMHHEAGPGSGAVSVRTQQSFNGRLRHPQ